jgi:hypothetical protein
MNADFFNALSARIPARRQAGDLYHYAPFWEADDDDLTFSIK